MTQKEIEKAIEILKRYSSIPEGKESFEDVCKSYDIAISALETVAKIPEVLDELKSKIESLDREMEEAEKANRIIPMGILSGAEKAATIFAIDIINEKLCRGAE